MKALFTYAADVPLGRVLGEYRRWLWPVGIVLAVNIAVLIGVVLPLRTSVENAAARAAASEQSLQEAMADMKNAEATRDGQSQASTDLDKFYADVLPANMTAARRITHIKLAQLARARGVDFQSGATDPQSSERSILEAL